MEQATVRDNATGLLRLRERLEALGGWLSMDSAPGEGTRSAVHLPAALTAPVDREGTAAPAGPEHRGDERAPPT